MQIWTLFEESNVKGKSKPDHDYYEKSESFRTFGTFEAAKAAMREAIKSYAEVEGELFDEEGYPISFQEDLMEAAFSENSDESPQAAMQAAMAIIVLIRDFFMGEDVADRVLAFAEPSGSGEMLFQSDENYISRLSDARSGDADAEADRVREPYAPLYEEMISDHIKTNALVMSDPSLHYFCRVQKAFAPEESIAPPAYFHIELVRTEVE